MFKKCSVNVQMKFLRNSCSKNVHAGHFEDANLCVLHAKWVTVFSKDLELVRRIKGDTV